jgi:hypothetical protein
MALSQALNPGRRNSNPGSGLPLLQSIYEDEGSKDQGVYDVYSWLRGT